MRRSFALASTSLVLVSTACGARGPLNFEVIEVVASADGSAPTTSTGPGDDSGSPANGSDSGSSSGSSSGGSSSGGLLGGADGGIIACGSCVTTQCASSIEACVADTTCATSLECIFTTCLGGLGGGGGSGSSGGGLSCITTCGGGLSGLSNLLPILECIGGTCGSDCGSLLGGLGGLGGVP
jgi:predicted small lipoprotein YifL